MAMDQVSEKAAPGPELYWRIAVRRRWWILIPFVLGWAAVLGASWVIPPKFRSDALILVEQQQVPQQYVVPNVTMDISARMNALTEQIMSRTRLVAIAQKFNLYPSVRSTGDPDALAVALRKDISIDLQEASRRGGAALTSFTLSYVSSSPQLAQQVTNELSSLFIDTSMRHSAEVSQQTTEFLQRQVELARKDLDEQEIKLRDFKMKYLGTLPQQLGSNLQILSGLQARLQSATDTLTRAQQQRELLQSMLSQYSSAQTVSSNSDAGTSPLAIEQQLQALRQQLTELEAKYTERHPDVLRVKRQIASLESQKGKLQNEIASQKGAPKKAPVVDVQAQGPVLRMEAQLKATEFEIANARNEIKRINGEIAQYQSRLNLTPVREQELATIVRDHGQAQKQFNDLLAKSQQSELATSLENQQQGERFRLIDPASLPQRPYFPDRMKMALAGLAVGLALGVVIAGLMEFIDLHVFTESQVKDIIGASIMVVGIPPLFTPSEALRNRRSSWLQGAVGCILVLVVCGITAFTIIRG